MTSFLHDLDMHNAEGYCPKCGAALGISGLCYVCLAEAHPLPRDLAYELLVKTCTGRLEMSREIIGEYNGMLAYKIHGRWTGGNRILFSGELIRELDYDHPQIWCDWPTLIIAGYILKFVEWYPEYDLAVFERYTVFGEPIMKFMGAGG